MHDVVGSGMYDQSILGQDIPKGCRIYRAIYLNAAGEATLASYEAARIAYDNRLDAGEIREEVYRFVVPADARERITLYASLNYLAYPSSFTRRFGLPRPESVEIAFARKELAIRQSP